MTNRLNNYMRKNFGFSSHEIRGMYVLIFLMIIAFSFPSFLKGYLKSIGTYSVPESEKKLLDQWVRESNLKISAKSVVKPGQLIIIGSFDPNKITVEEWEARGLSTKVAKRIRKYVDKGGRFYKQEDLLKIYGIDQELIQLYFDYMYFVPQPQPSKPKYSIKKEYKKAPVEVVQAKAFVKFDLNHADTIQLKTIRGIGSYFATSIVEYRDKLGGLISLNQLLEIYGMDEERLQLIKNYTVFEPHIIRKINVNTADFDQLYTHPYIDYGLAVAILKFRKQHGSFQAVEGLQEIVILKDSVFLKIRPYLTISD